MRQIFLVTALAASLQASAAESRSKLGFTFELSSDWLVLTAAQVQKTYERESLEGLGLVLGDRAAAEGILQRVKAGEVEYVFDRKHMAADFKNNISLQLLPPRAETPQEIARNSCPSLAGELRKLYGSEVVMAACGVRTLADVPFVVIEYRIAAQAANVIQFEMPFGRKGTLILVGGGNDAGLARIRDAQTSMARSAAQFVSAWRGAR
jgi:hypothetical protein